MSSRYLVFLAILALLGSALPVQEEEKKKEIEKPAKTEAPDEAELKSALKLAHAELLRRQERYVDDTGIRGRTDEELKANQAEEVKRLEAIFDPREGQEWPYEGVYRVGQNRHIPAGYRVGGTALVALALLAEPKALKDDATRAALKRSLDFVLHQVETNEEIDAGPQQGYDVRSWAHAYGLNLLIEIGETDLLREDAERKRLKKAIDRLLRCLEINQARGGGWNYTGGPSSSFMTGAILLVLYRAEDLGHEVDRTMRDRAIKALQASRRSNVAFSYAGPARGSIDIEASSARSACAELALHLAGRSKVDDLRRSVEAFFTGYEELLVRKSKQGTHEGPYDIAPYYFYFGHLFAARAIEALPEQERASWRGKMRATIWKTREEDGLWNDRVFPRSKSYGTAMVVLALQAEHLGLPARREK